MLAVWSQLSLLGLMSNNKMQVTIKCVEEYLGRNNVSPLAVPDILNLWLKKVLAQSFFAVGAHIISHHHDQQPAPHPPCVQH